jgi:hypothetical protein
MCDPPVYRWHPPGKYVASYATSEGLKVVYERQGEASTGGPERIAILYCCKPKQEAK